LSTLSFHETKNVTCGEGGALVINDPQFTERAEVIREKGTNRSRFFRGMVDKYTWIDAGSSYLLSEINAAVLCAQLEYSTTIQRRRGDAVALFRQELSGWAKSNGVELPVSCPAGDSPSHLFPLLFPDIAQRTRFLAFTREHGVATTFHYIPLHSSPAGIRFGAAPFGCPITADVSDRLARLPLFSDITPTEVASIVEVVSKFSC
jgi:dTDP-4-amino-4,6-dideoxygalactose transaminase